MVTGCVWTVTGSDISKYRAYWSDLPPSPWLNEPWFCQDVDSGTGGRGSSLKFHISYEIVKEITDVLYCLRLIKSPWRHIVVHYNRLKPYQQRCDGYGIQPPFPVTIHPSVQPPTQPCKPVTFWWWTTGQLSFTARHTKLLKFVFTLYYIKNIFRFTFRFWYIFV